MELTIGSELRIKGAGKELRGWCMENLVLPNPEYADRIRRGLWIGRTPQYLYLYRVEGEELVLPVGTGKDIRQFLDPKDAIKTDLADNGKLDFAGEIPLYEYQQVAVDAMCQTSCGILKSPCGSGKTQMGIALSAALARKTLWITHTQDLLTQSYERAAQYFPREIMGKITGGKVHIGTHFTFATVQTLCKLDLTQYRYSWDVIIVDECHRLAGTPTKITMFYRVLNNLAARYKFGLSATVHRSDGLIRSTFAALGLVIYQVPEAEVEAKTMKVSICERNTGVKASRSCLDTDGTMDYAKLIPYLVENPERNQLIVKDIVSNAKHWNLILSDRLDHLRILMGSLPKECLPFAAMIDGSMTSKKGKAERAAAIEDMRTGKKHFLFASYSLAKEGLDIPRLDRLYLTTPKKDFAVVTQSIGRIARRFPEKEDAICYDYLDDIAFCQNQYRRRKTHYRKAGCEL